MKMQRPFFSVLVATLGLVGCVSEGGIPRAEDESGESSEGSGGTEGGQDNTGGSTGGSSDGAGGGEPVGIGGEVSLECQVAMDCFDQVEPSQCVDFECVEGMCVETALDDGEECDAGDSCVASAECQNGVCTPKTVLPDGRDCDDGMACTTGDQCSMGVCVGQVECPDQECKGPGSCNPGTGQCEYENMPDLTECDDGNSCTDGDLCVAGECSSGNVLADNTDCDDGNLCTRNDSCQMGICTPGAEVTCGDPGTCEEGQGVCNPGTGYCEFRAVSGGLCEDGCEVGTCDQGSCEDRKPACYDAPIIQCKDDNTLEYILPVGMCTMDDSCAYTTEERDCDNGCADGACIPDATCENLGDACNDHNPCTHSDECNGVGECVGTPITCEDTDENDCSVTACNAVSGVCETADLPDGASCSDDDSCSVGDFCSMGVCQAGADLAGLEDQFEPNGADDEVPQLAKAYSCGDNDDNVRVLTAKTSSNDDEDWYRFKLHDDGGTFNLCGVRPTVHLDHLGDAGTYTVCAYYDCDNQGETPQISCSSGEFAADGPGGTSGCCMEVESGETGKAKIAPNCTGSDDSGDVYIRVTSENVTGCGYEMRWEDENGN